MSTPTWIVWSPMPPECAEEIATESMLDAARSWAERQFRRGMIVNDKTEVLAHIKGDADPRMSTYRLKLLQVAAPAYRAAFMGLAFEGVNPPPVGPKS